MPTYDISLVPGQASRNDISLTTYFGLVEPDTRPSYVIYLYPTAAVAKDITLRPNLLVAAAVSFPTQFAGLRAYFQGAIKELSLVAIGDAPTGMGGVLRVQKGGVVYAVYLVETSDPNATPLRVRTSTGTKAIRLKT